MTLDEILESAINPALAILPKEMSSDAARVMLLAIGLQESRFEHRWQVTNTPGVKGPARSFWQAEQGGGMVAGVLSHPATSKLAKAACQAHGVPVNNRDVWLSIENNDELAATLARLLLWTEPRSLPAVADEEGAWGMYLRAWRPGAHSRGTDAQKKELRAKWARNHAAARSALSAR
jgi:hypothetical protein